MANELKATIINMKNLSQNIADPVVVGAGDAAGRTLRVIFTQEAAAQFTPETKVYLSWWHQEKNIKGYNVFTEITDDEDEDFPPTWEIHYPKSMLYEGNVLACIQIVDGVSIATSTNFTIHILIDSNDGLSFIASDDYTEFQKAVIQLASVETQARKQLADQKLEFENMQLAFIDIRRITIENQNIVEEAKQIAENALGTATEALETIGTIPATATATTVIDYVDEKTGAAVADLDADLDASGTAQHAGVFVVSGVTQVDGELTSVDSTEVEVAGAAAAAEQAAKNYADSLLVWGSLV